LHNHPFALRLQSAVKFDTISLN